MFNCLVSYGLFLNKKKNVICLVKLQVVPESIDLEFCANQMKNGNICKDFTLLATSTGLPCKLDK